MNNMITYLHDQMIRNYEILILYVLKDIEIIELRRIIWEKIFEYEELELINQEWYEIELHELELDIERFNINDLELDSD